MRRNAQTVLQYTTAYPFKLPDTSMVCVFCCESYDDPSEFRHHMNIEHQDFKMYMAFAHIPEGFIKVDCTELKCRICSQHLQNIEDAADHLVKIHNKIIILNHDLGIHPFVIEKDKYSCTICNEKHSTLSLLSKHMHRHYVQYTCDACGKSYATKTSLHCHLRYNCGTGPSTRKCRKCKSVFHSLKERQAHLEVSKKCCQHVCNLCGERFVTWTIKQSHLTEVHNVPAKSYSCPECSLVFAQRNSFRAHFKIYHTNDYVECSYCDKRFENDKSLKKHVVIHTGERGFICTVCAKAFPRKSTLDQHMWIHREVKKHECKMCNKQFNQKVSWRTHMKSRHPDLEWTDVS